MKTLFPFSGLIAAALAITPFAGVNIAGFDFGMDIQGSQNLSQSQGPVLSLGNDRSDGVGQMQHFVRNGKLNSFRLPTTWQFLINSRNLNGSATSVTGRTSNGTLDKTNLAQYDQFVRACLNTGSSCIIDIHNYARFEGQVIGQGGPTNVQFASLWSQIATKYRNESRVMFGIMNEPHDLQNLSMWADTVQAAVTAIRNTGATSQTILLPGTEFTHASAFIRTGSAKELGRVQNPDGTNTSLVFEVHQYLDADGSGESLECVTDQIQDGFRPLSEFLVANGRKALVGEIGGGNTTSCLTNLCNALAFINANPNAYIGYTAWAAGQFSPTDYNLTMTPKPGPGGTLVDQKTLSQCVVGTRMTNATQSKTQGTTNMNGLSTGGTGASSPTSNQTLVTAGASSLVTFVDKGLLGSLAAILALYLST